MISETIVSNAEKSLSAMVATGAAKLAVLGVVVIIILLVLKGILSAPRSFNKSLRHVLISSILIMVMLTSAQADTNTQAYQKIIIYINPTLGMAGSTNDAYTATMIPLTVPSGGFFFLNSTIPAGYNFILPAKGKLIGTYSVFNQTKRANQIIIKIFSNKTSPPETVDVEFSTNYGVAFQTKKNLPLENIVIGATSLKLTRPTSSTPGYLNLSLGGTAGPIMKNQIVIVNMAKGTLKNPGNSGIYTWKLDARNSPAGPAFTGSFPVLIRLRK